MESFVIEGGRPLSGHVRAAGNKNGALPDPRRVPAHRRAGRAPERPADPRRRHDGRAARRPRRRGRVAGRRTRCASTRRPSSKTEVDEELSDRIRGSFLFAGPLLARFGRVLHLAAGRRLHRAPPARHPHPRLPAARRRRSSIGRRFELRADALRGTRIFLDEASVMGTENAVMAAVLAQGATVLMNAACEPHVQDLCRFLVSLGAQIDGIGSNVLPDRRGRVAVGRRAPDRRRAHRGGELHRPRRGHRRRHDDRRTSRPRTSCAILAAFERLGIEVELGETRVRVPPGRSSSSATTSATRSRRSRTAPGRRSRPT